MYFDIERWSFFKVEDKTERKETSSSLFNGFVIQTKGIGGILLYININIKVHKIEKTCQISIVLLHLH